MPCLARQFRTLAATLLAVGVATLALAAPATATGQPQRILAATPYMGWDSSYAFGTRYDEATILEQASNLISDGLQHDGYRLIWLDAGWWHGSRSHDGTIKVSPKQWPHGMAWLAATLHHEGFKVGLYTDAGRNGCAGPSEGMYGHYTQDIDTFARWGFDAVKVDYCGGAQQRLAPATVYGEIHSAIVHDEPHRPMMLEICVFQRPGQSGNGYPSFARSAFSSWTFGPLFASSWRTDTDIGSATQGVQWSSVVRNMLSDATEPLAAGPGHWNDPGYLSPGLGMDDNQFSSQMGMWVMLAAPLMISANLATLTPASYAALSNRLLTGIDQDRLGRQAQQAPPAAVTSVPASSSCEAWIKPLTGNRYAIALIDLSRQPMTVSTNTQAIGIPTAASYKLTDAWTGVTTKSAGAITASVSSNGTAIFIVTLVRPAQR